MKKFSTNFVKSSHVTIFNIGPKMALCGRAKAFKMIGCNSEWSPKRVDARNQKRLPDNTHVHRTHVVTFSRIACHGREMVKLNKGSIVVITETQFGIQSQVR